MSTWFVLVSVLAAVNPPRVAARLPSPDGERRRTIVVGTASAAGILVVLALAADAVLRGLELSVETWSIAAGAVAVLAAARHLVFAPAAPVPSLGGLGLIPVAFPLLLVPEAVVLAVLYGATESMGLVVAALVLALAPVPVWAGRDGLVTRGLVRLLAAVLVVAGIGLMVAGIRDV